MLVLDYVREMLWDDPIISLPAFHKGHLGFVPGTTVYVALLSPPAGDPAHNHRESRPEIVISQFQPELGQFAELSVTLKDKIGVVERLTQSISSLGINILLQESSSIHHFNEHHVNLVLNVGSLYAAGAPTRSPHYSRVLYSTYGDAFDVGDPGMVRLFDTIVLHCFDILAWVDRGGRAAPAIQISRFSRRAIEVPGSAVVERIQGTASGLRLPEEVHGALRNQMQPAPGSERVTYIFVSDTINRNMRVFFLTPEEDRPRFHVAFHHNNVAGALATILRLVAQADFNILTSLLRRHTPGRSVWETVLEYCGDERPPPTEEGYASSEQLHWLAAELERRVVAGVMEGVQSDIALGMPLYPRTNAATATALGIPVGRDLEFLSPTTPESPMDALRRDEEYLQAESPAPHHFDAMADLLQRIRRKLERSQRPTIFVSYPAGAEAHYALLKEGLEPAFKLVAYDEPDAEPLVEQVERKIADADFFMGVWHHEERELRDGTYTVSPWLPFEYGIALAQRKDTIVIHSEKLPESIWKRIDTGRAHPAYTDLTFASVTVPFVAHYCRSHFRTE